MTLTTILGYLCAIVLPPAIGLHPKGGVAGLTASAGIAGRVEFVLLRRTLNERIGRTGLPVSFVIKLWSAATAAGAVGFGLKVLLPQFHPIPLAIVVLGAYGVLYFALTAAFRLPEAHEVVGKFWKPISRRLKR